MQCTRQYFALAPVLRPCCLPMLGCRCIPCSRMTEAHSKCPEECSQCSSRSAERGDEAGLQHGSQSPNIQVGRAPPAAEEELEDNSPRMQVSGVPAEVTADADMSIPGPPEPSVPNAEDMRTEPPDTQQHARVFMGFSPANVKQSAALLSAIGFGE